MWTKIIDSPLFSVFYGLMLVGSVILGIYIARRFYLQRNKIWEKSGVESSLISLFALVLSFTLGEAYNSAHHRNTLIHDQADALAQMHRQVLFLPAPYQKQVQQFLLHHIDAQIEFYNRRIKTSDALIQKVTRQNGEFFNSVRLDSVFKSNFNSLSASNDHLSATTFRMIYSYDERTPLIIIFLLVISSWLIGLLIGFMNGFHKSRHILVPMLYLILAGFTMQAIRDLDNPMKGGIRPNYKNLLDIRNAIQHIN